MEELIRVQGRTGERGLSLVELLVSVTILAIATTIALFLYDGAQRTLKRGENVSEQQQATRIAFDLITTDLRMAGYNTNPDGNKARPDEQIESMHRNAVVIRADFDARDPAESLVPELALAGPGSAFLTVSTGNDEIRAFVLAKQVAGVRTGPDSIDFHADVNPPVRDGAVEAVTIDQVVLSPIDPPYTLYRISLDDNGNPVSTVMVENVASLQFSYFDHAGNTILPVGGAETADQKRDRARVRRIEVEVEMLTRDPDSVWVDLDDPDADTNRFGKFAMVGDITPRNLGRVGIKDPQSDTIAPLQPARPTLFTGHCGGLYVTWPPNDPGDEVSYYKVRYGTDAVVLDGLRSTADTEIYIGGLADGVRHWVAIEAIDAAGNQSVRSLTADVVTSNQLPENTPEAPTGLLGTVGLNGRVELTWNPSVQNSGVTEEGNLNFTKRLRELGGYRLFRGTNDAFIPGAGNRIADEGDVGAVPQPSFVDTLTVNCKQYYYRVAAVDECGNRGPYSDAVPGSAWSAVRPEIPGNVQAFFDVPGKIRIDWDNVREDVNGDSIYIEEYKVFRTWPFLPAGQPPIVPDDFMGPHAVVGKSRYLDTVDPAPEQVWYYVTAFDSCAPPNESDPSAPASPGCSFSGDVQIVNPAPGTQVWGSTDIDVSVVGGAGNYPTLRIQYFHEDTSTLISSSVIAAPGPDWTVVWDGVPASGFPAGDYTVTVEVDQDNGLSICTRTTSIALEVAGP